MTSEERSVTHPTWPYIDQMLAQGRIAYIDYALAERLLRDYPDTDQSVAAFLCHLSIAIREGHLCIKVDEEGIYPEPCHTWLESKEETTDNKSPHDNTVPSLKDWQAINNFIIRGAALLPKGLVTEVTNSCATPATPICRFGSFFYFQRYWFYETLFLKHFQIIAQAVPALIPDQKLLQDQIHALLQQDQLLPEQAEAILSACRNSFTVICGGPGTGKTYTAGNLIKTFWTALDADQQQNCEIALAAPTGKAAANLQRSLCAATSHLVDFVPIKAKTLHALLGIRPHHSQRDTAITLLSADLILVDESSMIDANLMSQLLAAIKPGARLVLLGDRHQLPPVASGALFSDIITHLTKHFSNQVVELNTCLRIELKAIIDFADTINRGDTKSVIDTLTVSSASSGISRLSLKGEHSSKATQQALIEQVAPHFHKPSLNKEDHRQLLDAYQNFRLLSPLRKGPFGIDELNRLIYSHLIKKMRGQSWFSTPIMLVSNDYRLKLFNGEVGVLVRHGDCNDSNSQYLKEEDFAVFLDSSGEHAHAIRKLPALVLPNYEYAYCLSVHKSQGSEFNHVLLLMPEGSERFGREILYTAATRARKKLEVWGNDAVLCAAITRQACRLSGVVQRLDIKKNI